MKIISKVFLFIVLGIITSSFYSLPNNKEFSKEDILKDKEFSKFMFALHKSKIIIQSSDEIYKDLKKVNDYMAANKFSCCDYQVFDKNAEFKNIEYYENQCVIVTQYDVLQSKYSEIFTDNFMDLVVQFDKLHPELKINAKDVLKTKNDTQKCEDQLNKEIGVLSTEFNNDIIKCCKYGKQPYLYNMCSVEVRLSYKKSIKLAITNYDTCE
jgi:hypothetical protein